MSLTRICAITAWISLLLHSVSSSEDIRLAGGSKYAGRVEVYRDGEWGTVCDDFWDFNDALVVCRQLGFVGAIKATRQAVFGRGSGPIHFDDVDCIGNEKELEDCVHNDWHDCLHLEDAGVVCSPQSYENGAIRLIDDFYVTDDAGGVQIFDGTNWDYLRVCVNTFDVKDAAVVCRQIGFDRITYFIFFNIYLLPFFDFKFLLNCSGEESKLSECPRMSCSEVKGVFVRCADAVISANTVPITTDAKYDRCSFADKPRLFGGNRTAGGVEVCLNERWGTVCDDNWDIQDAEVVCRELGFKGAYAALLKAYFGQGKGPVQVDEVGCLGNETSIFSCDYTEITNCGHEEDASVSCIPYTEGDVRLVSHNLTSGFVEIYIGLQWAAICGRDWGLQEEAVACRQIGFKDAFSASSKASYSNSSMVVDEVICSGEEKSLLQCRHKKDLKCRYQENAFVICVAVESLADAEIDRMETQYPIKKDENEGSPGLIIFLVFVGIFICVLALTAVYRYLTIRSSRNVQVRNVTEAKVNRPLPSLREQKNNKKTKEEENDESVEQYQSIGETSEVKPYERKIYISGEGSS